MTIKFEGFIEQGANLENLISLDPYFNSYHFNYDIYGTKGKKEEWKKYPPKKIKVTVSIEEK